MLLWSTTLPCTAWVNYFPPKQLFYFEVTIVPSFLIHSWTRNIEGMVELTALET